MSSDLNWYNALPAHDVDVDGAPVHYKDIGEGPTLVFVHGWPLSGSTWRHVARDLSADYRCIIVDLPGAGGSPLHWHHQEFFRHLGVFLDRFCDALALENYGLLGFDSGGAGVRFHAHHAPHAKAILLSNTEVPDHTPSVVRQLQLMGRLPFAAAVFRVLLSSRTYLRTRFGFGATVADRSHLDGDFADATLPALKRNVPEAIAHLRRADLVNIGSILQDEVHETLNVPTAFVWGDKDRFFPTQKARIAFETIPGATDFHVVDDAALLVHEERPAEYVRAARQLFDAHLRPQSLAPVLLEAS